MLHLPTLYITVAVKGVALFADWMQIVGRVIILLVMWVTKGKDNINTPLFSNEIILHEDKLNYVHKNELTHIIDDFMHNLC